MFPSSTKRKTSGSKLGAAIKVKGGSLKTGSAAKKVTSLKDPAFVPKPKKEMVYDSAEEERKRRIRARKRKEEAAAQREAEKAERVEKAERKRKRVVEEEPEEEEEELAVVEEPSTEVALVKRTTSLTARQQKNVEKKLVTMFADNTDLILDLLDRRETDGAHTLIYQSLLQTLVDMVPIAESAVRKSNGRFGMYQFNQLVSQLRETLADVQATRDKGQMGAHLVERFVRPSLMNLAAQVSLAFVEIDASAKINMDRETYERFSRTTIHDIRKNLAQYMTMQMEDLVNKVSQSFS